MSETEREVNDALSVIYLIGAWDKYGFEEWVGILRERITAERADLISRAEAAEADRDLYKQDLDEARELVRKSLPVADEALADFVRHWTENADGWDNEDGDRETAAQCRQVVNTVARLVGERDAARKALEIACQQLAVETGCPQGDPLAKSVDRPYKLAFCLAECDPDCPSTESSFDCWLRWFTTKGQEAKPA